MHFLKLGYDVTFCDIFNALKKVKKKLKINKIKKKFKIIKFSKKNNFLKTKNQIFDYIICFSVFNNLGDRKNAEKYINFFHRILKKNGKIIIDSNIRNKHNYKVINKKKLYTTHPKMILD